MNPNSADRTKPLKIAISVIATVGLIAHLAFPNLAIDAISLSLLVVAVLPWLAPLVKAAELPGGFKIEFQDVKEAAERVAAGAPEVIAATGPHEPLYMAISEQDPGLALVGLRIEIEKRLRQLAERSGIVKSRPLAQLTKELEELSVLSAESASGLRELIALGNQAAHGVRVGPDVAYSAVEFGPKVLQILDAKLAAYPERGLTTGCSGRSAARPAAEPER